MSGRDPEHSLPSATCDRPIAIFGVINVYRNWLIKAMVFKMMMATMMLRMIVVVMCPSMAACCNYTSF